MGYQEGNRYLYLDTPLGDSKLLLQSFTGTEGLNQLFDFQLELLNATPIPMPETQGKRGPTDTLNAERMKDEDYMAFILGRVPLKRVGQPVEVVPAVLLLASAGGAYITGSTVFVDGGWTAQ